MLSQELNKDKKTVPPQQGENLEIKIRFTYIEAIKEADGQFGNLEYPIDMNLGEVTRRLDGTAVIGFSLRVATSPQLAVFAVKGDATIKGSAEKIQKVTIPESGSPPTIWREIYQEAISTVVFLARFLGVPPPPLVSNT